MASAQVTIELEAEPEPIPPVAVDDTVGPIREGEFLSFDPRINDADQDGSPSALTIISDSDFVTVEPGGVRVEAPEATTDLPYRVQDPQGLTSETAFITILVTENQAPTIDPIQVETEFEMPVTIDIGAAGQPTSTKTTW